MSTALSKEVCTSIAFLDHTEASSEMDVLVAKALLEDLSPLSNRINLFVHSRFFFVESDCESPRGTWDSIVTWISENSTALREELRNVSLLIVAGPLEVSPSEVRFRVNNDESFPPMFNRGILGWRCLRSQPSRNVAAPGEQVSQKIPTQLLLALGAAEAEFKTEISPGTRTLHDALFRYTWTKAS